MNRGIIGRWMCRAAALLAITAGALSMSHAAVRLPVSLQDPRDGKTVAVEAKGKVLHVVFFATWCPPCLAELERLADLEARWAGRGYRVLLVGVETRQTAPRLAKFIAESKPPGELLFDAGGGVEKAWDVQQLPTHILFDASGNELLRSGALDRSLVERLEALMAARERKP